jgi:hypothetical protein
LNGHRSLAEILLELRVEGSDSEFGYRMQALFAHILIRIGCHIDQINTHGHPDIRATRGDREVIVQVKTVLHSSAGTVFDLSQSDFAGISKLGRRDGFLAVLDCAEPAQWILISSDRAATLLTGPVRIATLVAVREREMSVDCTEEFEQIVRSYASDLRNLSYGLLRDRALQNQPL